jgi:hypothetical protein
MHGDGRGGQRSCSMSISNLFRMEELYALHGKTGHVVLRFSSLRKTGIRAPVNKK